MRMLSCLGFLWCGWVLSVCKAPRHKVLCVVLSRVCPCRDEPAPLRAVRAQLPPRVPAPQGLRPRRHLPPRRVPLEARPGTSQPPSSTALWTAQGTSQIPEQLSGVCLKYLAITLQLAAVTTLIRICIKREKLVNFVKSFYALVCWVFKIEPL